MNAHSFYAWTAEIELADLGRLQAFERELAYEVADRDVEVLIDQVRTRLRDVLTQASVMSGFVVSAGGKIIGEVTSFDVRRHRSYTPIFEVGMQGPIEYIPGPTQYDIKLKGDR